MSRKTQHGATMVVGGAGVCSLVHVPHLVHQEDGLRLLSSRSSTDWTDALLCVQRPPNLQPEQVNSTATSCSPTTEQLTRRFSPTVTELNEAWITGAGGAMGSNGNVITKH